LGFNNIKGKTADCQFSPPHVSEVEQTGSSSWYASYLGAGDEVSIIVFDKFFSLMASKGAFFERILPEDMTPSPKLDIAWVRPSIW
jgi:hypothetical protein